MFRRLRTILCLLSLVGMGTLWQRSYTWYLLATYGTADGGTVVFASDMGGLYVGRYTPTKAGWFDSMYPAHRGWNTTVFANDRTTSSMEFAIGNYTDRSKPIRWIDGEDSGNRVRYVVVADWAVMAFLLAIGPAVWAWGWIRARRRRRAGCCAVCGYDLRATPAKCPECGSVPSGARP